MSVSTGAASRASVAAYAAVSASAVAPPSRSASAESAPGDRSRTSNGSGASPAAPATCRSSGRVSVTRRGSPSSRSRGPGRGGPRSMVAHQRLRRVLARQRDGEPVLVTGRGTSKSSSGSVGDQSPAPALDVDDGVLEPVDLRARGSRARSPPSRAGRPPPGAWTPARGPVRASRPRPGRSSAASPRGRRAGPPGHGCPRPAPGAGQHACGPRRSRRTSPWSFPRSRRANPGHGAGVTATG